MSGRRQYVENYEQYIRPAEVIRRLKIKQCTLQSMIRWGKFPKPQKIGKKAVGWPPEEIEPMLLEFERFYREEMEKDDG